ncbi:hypothetical protein [Yoonia sp.]|uniref:hypothetical protein n=1 Tax=Yoonia sp. TaxID=2212373 RepID=UPI003F6BDD49
MKHALAFFLLASPVLADPAQVLSVVVSGDRFDVTLLHPDSGWDHYTDGWEVLDTDGNRLGFRELFHPHVNEQPFTRSQSGITVPAGATVVHVRARCNIDGWSDTVFEVRLPQ